MIFVFRIGEKSKLACSCFFDLTKRTYRYRRVSFYLSIEKFLVSRRLMYWQVYLHKTVLSAEMMLVKIIRRAKELIATGKKLNASTKEFDHFLQPATIKFNESDLEIFCKLDDHDVMTTIKNWGNNDDKILATLCRSLVERNLLKVKLQADPFEDAFVGEKKKEAVKALGIPETDVDYFVFTGIATNTTYDPKDERITILFKDGQLKDISKVDHALIHQHLNTAVKKYYICYLRL